MQKRTHKFKRLFCSKKTVLNADYKNFCYTNHTQSSINTYFRPKTYILSSLCDLAFRLWRRIITKRIVFSQSCFANFLAEIEEYISLLKNVKENRDIGYLSSKTQKCNTQLFEHIISGY